jgi:hypothetical protein
MAGFWLTPTKERQHMGALVTVGSNPLQALRGSSHPALRRLSVEESDEAIVITGRVGSYYLKQVAQEAVLALRDGRVVINRVLVVKD